MSPADPHIDLDLLARERAAPASLPRPRRWLRFAVPLILLLAFAAILSTSLGDFLRGAREVTIVRPVPAAAGAARAAPGQVVAQAAGWIEPDPFPIRVTALAPGVVRGMLVQESDVLSAGDPVALLVDDEARILCDQAEGILAGARAQADRAQAELAAARASFEAALGLNQEQRTAEAELVGGRAEAQLRAQAVLKGRAQVAVAESELEVQRYLAEQGAAGPRQVELAQARVEEAHAELAVLEAEAAAAAARVPVAEARLERVRRDLELRIEDRLRVEAAEAEVAFHAGHVAEVQATRNEARLRLERMTVRSPAAGVVLERLATVGTPLSGEASAVATLYDPASIRARVDVPQPELPRLFAGQRATIESDARTGRPYAGDVIRVVRQADIQKVTLQAHVRVLDADELLRPEMLVQVRFLAPEAATEVESNSGLVAVPARLLIDGVRVWVLDPLGRTAALREVKAGARDGDLVVIESGLDLSDKLLDPGGEALEPGDRVREKEARP